MKDLNYYKNNAEEDYATAPISVLRYITELEKKKQDINCANCSENNSKQLHTKVFNLANELAKAGYGNQAVRMHQICNGM